jgi:hypothetical protein
MLSLSLPHCILVLVSTEYFMHSDSLTVVLNGLVGSSIVCSDVLEKLSASIFTVTKFGSGGC